MCSSQRSGQGLDQGIGRLIAIRGSFGGHPEHHVLNRLRHPFGPQFLERKRVIQMFDGDGKRALSGKGDLPGQRVIEDNAQRVDITAPVYGLPCSLLW